VKANRDLDTQRSKANSLQIQLTAQTQRLDQALSDLQTIKIEEEKRRSQLRADMQAQIDDLDITLVQQNTEIERLRLLIQSLEQNSRFQDAEIEALKRQVAELQCVNTRLKQEKAGLIDQLSAARDQLESQVAQSAKERAQLELDHSAQVQQLKRQAQERERQLQKQLADQSLQLQQQKDARANAEQQARMERDRWGQERRGMEQQIEHMLKQHQVEMALRDQQMAALQVKVEEYLESMSLLGFRNTSLCTDLEQAEQVLKTERETTQQLIQRLEQERLAAIKRAQEEQARSAAALKEMERLKRVAEAFENSAKMMLADFAAAEEQGTHLRDYHVKQTREPLVRSKIEEMHKLWSELHSKLSCNFQKCFPHVSQELSPSAARQLGMKAYLRPMPFAGDDDE